MIASLSGWKHTRNTPPEHPLRHLHPLLESFNVCRAPHEVSVRLGPGDVPTKKMMSLAHMEFTFWEGRRRVSDKTKQYNGW